jgi:hypothetical protein
MNENLAPGRIQTHCSVVRGKWFYVDNLLQVEIESLVCSGYVDYKFHFHLNFDFFYIKEIFSALLSFDQGYFVCKIDSCLKY